MDKNDMIREIQYLDWLSNVVVVKNKDGKIGFKINFTYLNKACPKRKLFSTHDRHIGGCHDWA